MKLRFWAGIVVAGVLVAACRTNNPTAPENSAKANQSFTVRGIVRSLSGDQTVVIAHEKIPNYMPAMTMPFKVRQTNELAGLNVGDEITFRLLVNNDESWIDRIEKTGQRHSVTDVTSNNSSTGAVQIASSSSHPLMNYQFTNQLGQTVSLSQFNGRALAITFIFTRCPIPEYCPRLSKNFAEASRKLAAMSDAPTNWHFLSITFDPVHDTPEILHSYAVSQQYDPRHWSFLTGAPDKIAELARASDVTYQPEGNSFNHNFHTLIINAKGQLQMNFPISGDLSDAIVVEMLKAAAVTNR